MHRNNYLKERIKPLRLSMYDFNEKEVRDKLNLLFHQDTIIHFSHPFGDIKGPVDYYSEVYKPLFFSMPDLERRDYIVIAGKTEKNLEWIPTLLR